MAEKEAPRNTEVHTPFGGVVTVTAERAKTLKGRAPIRMADGTDRRYADTAEETVTEAVVTAAKPPRKTQEG